MTLATVQRRLLRAGARLELVRGHAVVRGWHRLSRRDRELVTDMRSQLAEALSTPLVESAPETPASTCARKVVGQRSELVGGQLRWSPLYADEATRVFNPSAGGIGESLARLDRAIKGVARPEAARQSGTPRQWPGRFRLRTGV